MPRFVTFEVRVPAAAEDDAVAALWECGTVGVRVDEPLQGEVLLAASFPEGTAWSAVRGALADVPGAAVRAVDVPEVDWVARFREDFRSFDAAGFHVVPEWEERPPGPDVLVIDPGRAFGTGTHQTTQLCLALLAEEAARRPLARVLDVGAGTGILGIAALRRGAHAAVAVDLDSEATASCLAHARLNEVPLRVVQGDGGQAFREAAFDLVLANLMAPLLVARARELCALAAPGGVLVLSGLLLDDVPLVAGAFGAGGSAPPAIDERDDGEWAALRVRLP